MISANSVMPVFTAASWPKPGILRERQFRIQIEDTPTRTGIHINQGLQQFTLQLNRPAARMAIKSGGAEMRHMRVTWVRRFPATTNQGLMMKAVFGKPLLPSMRQRK